MLPGMMQAGFYGAGGVGPTDPYWANVSFLNGWEDDGSGYGGATLTEGTDESTYGHVPATSPSGLLTIEAGGKFGDCLVQNLGASSGFIYNDNDCFNFGSGAFTVETWVNFITLPTSGLHYLVTQYAPAQNQRSWALLVNAGNLQMLLSTAGTSGTTVASASWTPSASVWYHIAGDFDGTAYRTYVDGVMFGKSTTLVTPLHNSTAYFCVGGATSNASISTSARARYDETRVTKGVARYASDSGYTVPIAAFPRG